MHKDTVFGAIVQPARSSGGTPWVFPNMSEKFLVAFRDKVR